MLSFENMEIVIGGVASSVAFCSKGSPKDDKVFSNACVDNIHSAGQAGSVAVKKKAGPQKPSVPHCAASIVEHPFVLPGIDVFRSVRSGKIGNNVVDDAAGVIRVLGNRVLGEFVQKWLIKNVPSFLIRLILVRNSFVSLPDLSPYLDTV